MNNNFQAGSSLATLQEVGQQLHENIYPLVLDGGIVMPSGTASPPLLWATKENENEKTGQRRPATRSWQGTAGWQRPSEGGRSARTAAPIICPELKESYEAGLEDVMKSYPNSLVWQQDDGFWLQTESKLLPELWQKAVFIIGIPFARAHTIRAWGFWKGIPMTQPMWIGPRHTNFGDGSVCAFEPRDGTWDHGGSLVTLIDLYTVWALRHLHLQIFGRWPGRQVAHFAFERIVELKHDELCGCGSDKFYKDCCKQTDRTKDIIEEAVNLGLLTGRERCPPRAIINFIRKTEIPRLIDFLPVNKVFDC